MAYLGHILLYYYDTISGLVQLKPTLLLGYKVQYSSRDVYNLAGSP